jgi:hypothetical protein
MRDAGTVTVIEARDDGDVEDPPSAKNARRIRRAGRAQQRCRAIAGCADQRARIVLRTVAAFFSIIVRRHRHRRIPFAAANHNHATMRSNPTEPTARQVRYAPIATKFRSAPK